MSDSDSTSHLISPSGVQDMTWFSADFVYYILCFLVSSEVSILCMKNYLPARFHFSSNSLRIQRNMAVYILEVVVTFILFLMTLSSGMPLIVGKGNVHDILVSRTNLTILITLYAFELCYRPSMNWQLTLHHIFTIALCIVSVQSTIETQDKKLIAGGLILSFTANTEQLCFVSLFMYRLKHKYAGPIMRIAAIQSLACKLLAVIGLYIIGIEADWTDKNINMFPAHGWFVANRVLLLTLIPGYGAYILWKISFKTQPSAEIRKSVELEKAASPPLSLRSIRLATTKHLSFNLTSRKKEKTVEPKNPLHKSLVLPRDLL